MYAIDYNRPKLAGIPHHISGEVWFQLVSSWLLALPSIGICAYALIQTKRYHDLDEERIRPALLMESAEILACMVNWQGFEGWAYKMVRSEPQLDEYKAYRKNHYAYDYLSFLEFNADLILKSGESVGRIIIQQIVIQIEKDQYIIKFTDTIDNGQDKFRPGADIPFSRSYKNGQEEYHIKWAPDFKDITLEKSEQEGRKRSSGVVRQNLGKESDSIQEAFWKDLHNAVVDSEYNTARRDMEWRILMSIEYGMNETRSRKKPMKAVWRIRWHGTDSHAVNDYMFRRCAQEGILSAG